MAASRKLPSASDIAVPAGRTITVGLSGGIDSVVLLHVLHAKGVPLRALHVNHGLSPNAGQWESFCRKLCVRLEVPFKSIKVKISVRKDGLEAAARTARYSAFRKAKPQVLALAHQLDDQAETVLFNLLRGTGLRGASGMAAKGQVSGLRVVRPMLDVPRSAIAAYAKAHRLKWIHDESNENEALTRNFIRRRVGPLLEQRFPRWRESLARAARHFAAEELDAQRLLRAYLAEQGLRAPSEAKLIEMLKQLSSRNAAVAHDGKVLRSYRNKVYIDEPARKLKPMRWKGESKLQLAGGELHFEPARGQGIRRDLLKRKDWTVRQRSGGERFRPEAGRPSRTLKNLFQEAGVPPWERERLPLLFCGADLVWIPGFGVDAAYVSAGRAPGVLPSWQPSS